MENEKRMDWKKSKRKRREKEKNKPKLGFFESIRL